ncbi:hypothetical protein [Flammeovirga sp. SJP92]|uniref:hypothetical protein n=1 Tax=Flammeovirga sp. SJP92 TaxID=1775430 RepID=UPI0012FAF3F5|nr:hypothetical protein [Flammeovirga sp. SJP92]
MELEGRLCFYSETGTEGGYWALQESKYIKLVSPTFGVSNKQTVYDIENDSRIGIASKSEVLLNNKWLPLPDPITQDSDYLESSLYKGEEQGDFLADDRLMEKYDFKINYTEDRANEKYGKGNWKFSGHGKEIILKDGSKMSFGITCSPSRPYGIPQNAISRVTINWNDGRIEENRESNTLLVESWDYKGLHILENQDVLKIKDPESLHCVWVGQIDLKQFGVFQEHAKGAWIHAEQKNFDREKWAEYFFNKHPAILKKKEKKHTTMYKSNGGQSTELKNKTTIKQQPWWKRLWS